MSTNNLKSLPNEVWLYIISNFTKSMKELRNISIIKPELFTLFLHEYDPQITPLDSLYFSHLAHHQQSHPHSNSQTIYIHEICQRKPSDTYGRENHGLYRYAGDSVCTVNNRDFQNYYHQDLQSEIYKKDLYYVFDIKGHLSVSNSIEKSIGGNGSYRILWNVSFPRLFIFTELENLFIYNESNQPANQYDLNLNLNEEVFPKLLRILWNSVSRDSPICIDNVSLPKLEVLSIRWGILKRFQGVNVPNLRELEVSMISSSEEGYNVDNHRRVNLPFVEIDESMSVREQLERGMIRYENPSFHTNSALTQLKKFQLLIFDKFHNSLDAYFLYFLDLITTFKFMEDLTLDLLHLFKNPMYPDQKLESIGVLMEIIRWKLVEKLDAVKEGESQLHKVHIHAPNDSEFVDDDLVAKIKRCHKLQDLSLLNVCTRQDITWDRLPDLQQVYLKFKPMSSFIYFESDSLKSLFIELDIMNPHDEATEQAADQSTLFQYLESLNSATTPKLKSLSIEFQYTPQNSFADDQLWDTPKYDIFNFSSQHLTLPTLTNLCLRLTFAQLLVFLSSSDKFHFPNLKCLNLLADLRFCYDLVHPKDQTAIQIDNNVQPQLSIHAPKLKKLMLNISNQCELHPEHDIGVEKIKRMFQIFKITSYFPELYKICYEKYEDSLFTYISLDSRLKKNGIILSGAESDDFEYVEGEEERSKREKHIEELAEEDSEEEEEYQVHVELVYFDSD